MTFDVNGDREITPNVDVSYGLYPGTYRVGVQSYLGPGAWTGLQRSRARFAAGFGRSMGPSPPHRIWELAIPLAEIKARPGQLIRLGLNTYSESPPFNDY
ncbi:MAG: hypothetical protein GTO40_20790, partial [Deltaproteobacteria bacterium]|nr:hypothetical protein [Deltaproteobacteria bacterium]